MSMLNHSMELVFAGSLCFRLHDMRAVPFPSKGQQPFNSPSTSQAQGARPNEHASYRRCSRVPLIIAKSASKCTLKSRVAFSRIAIKVLPCPGHVNVRDPRPIAHSLTFWKRNNFVRNPCRSCNPLPPLPHFGRGGVVPLIFLQTAALMRAKRIAWAGSMRTVIRQGAWFCLTMQHSHPRNAGVSFQEPI